MSGSFENTNVPRRATPGIEKAGSHLPAQGFFKMLLAKGKISKEMTAMLSTWRHSGFHVFCGKRILPKDDTAMKNLARYIIRASFSQEQMTYLPEESRIIYLSDGNRQD